MTTADELCAAHTRCPGGPADRCSICPATDRLPSVDVDRLRDALPTITVPAGTRELLLPAVGETGLRVVVDPAAREATVAAVARTLEWAASWLAEEREAWDSPAVLEQVEHYRRLADVLDRHGVIALEDACCPLCQEVVCDEDCPLAEVRP